MHDHNISLSVFTPPKILHTLIIILSCIQLSACWPFQDDNETKNQLQKIRESGELRVGTVYNPLSYFFGNNENASGFDYELAEKFAEYLGVKLKIIAHYNSMELPPLLQNDAIDLIASQYQAVNSTYTDTKLSPQLYTVDQVVAYKTGTFRPKNFAQVDDIIWVVQGTSQERLLQKIALKNPNLQWQATADADEEELLRKVSEHEIKYALVDSHNLSLNQLFYPLLARAIIVKKATSVHWQIKNTLEDSLQAALITFIGTQHATGELGKLKDKYFGQFAGFDYVDTRAFLKAIETKLPEFEPLFRQYAGELDWRLIASISYQESHWQPEAISPTGVRGLMMLTNATAKEVGVTDRLDPEHSVKGGVTYLNGLFERLPDTIPADEKFWFTLAAYNIGFGHLMDARRLTKRRGDNPDSWRDVKTTLPLLMQKRWNRDTRYGYARGAEAAAYVLNIRQYYQSLVWQDSLNEKKLALADQNLKFKKLIPPITPIDAYVAEETENITNRNQDTDLIYDGIFMPSDESSSKGASNSLLSFPIRMPWQNINDETVITKNIEATTNEKNPQVISSSQDASTTQQNSEKENTL